MLMFCTNITFPISYFQLKNACFISGHGKYKFDDKIELLLLY